MRTINRNNLKNNLFALESVFLDFSYWIQGYRAVQRAHRALLLAVDSANEQYEDHLVGRLTSIPEHPSIACK